MADDLPLFAYGTLLTGARDPGIRRLVARATRRLGPARVRGRLHDQGGYPGLVGTGSETCWVRGVLLELVGRGHALRLLDGYEGFDPSRPNAGEYVRVALPVERLPGYETVTAWTYLLNIRRVRPGPRIVGGDWRRVGK